MYTHRAGRVPAVQSFCWHGAARALRTASLTTLSGMHSGTNDCDGYAAKLLADNASGRCFICELAEEETTPEHEIVVYRDEHCVVFLPPWQRL